MNVVSRYQRAGETRMGVLAHNLGRAELALGPQRLRELARDTSAPLLSANARDAQGQPIAQLVRVVSAAGRRIAITGIVSPSYATAAVQVRHGRNRNNHQVHFYLNYSAAAQEIDYPYAAARERLKEQSVPQSAKLKLEPWGVAIVEELR